MTELETRLSETLISLSRQYELDQKQLAKQVRDLQQQVEVLSVQQKKLTGYFEKIVLYLKRELEH